MSRSVSVRAFLVGSMVLAGSWPALAGGLYLKLSAEKSEVRADEPITLRLAATATRSFDLPAAPTLLVDEGSGMQPRSDLQCQGSSSASPSRITPEHNWAGSCEISLAKPGDYRIRIRYRLADQVVETNKVSVKVLAAGPKTAQD